MMMVLKRGVGGVGGVDGRRSVGQAGKEVVVRQT